MIGIFIGIRYENNNDNSVRHENNDNSIGRYENNNDNSINN